MKTKIRMAINNVLADLKGIESKIGEYRSNWEKYSFLDEIRRMLSEFEGDLDELATILFKMRLLKKKFSPIRDDSSGWKIYDKLDAMIQVLDTIGDSIADGK